MDVWATAQFTQRQVASSDASKKATVFMVMAMNNVESWIANGTKLSLGLLHIVSFGSRYCQRIVTIGTSGAGNQQAKRAFYDCITTPQPSLSVLNIQ